MNSSASFEIQFQLRETLKHAQQSATTPAIGRLPQITRALALAIYFDSLIQKGDAKDYSDIGRLTGLCRERVSQIMRLAYLAPDIQMELLYLPPSPSGRRFIFSETAVRRIANLLSWGDQRTEWRCLKAR